MTRESLNKILLVKFGIKYKWKYDINSSLNFPFINYKKGLRQRKQSHTLKYFKKLLELYFPEMN